MHNLTFQFIRRIRMNLDKSLDIHLDKTKKGQNTYVLTLSFVVGVTRFELVTSSVSGQRSPPELNARSGGALFSARNNIPKPIGSVKHFFKKILPA